MTHQQPNAFCAGLRKALDLANERHAGLNRQVNLACSADPWAGGGLYQLCQLIDTLQDQLLEAGGFLGDAPEPETRVTVRGWTVCLDEPDRGWFERDSDGTGGGLWFEGDELVDYDGVSCLPAAVAEGIRSLGLTVPPDME
jgi:hypothetical protein